MSSKDYIIAKYESKGKHFEILVDPNLAFQYRESGKPSIEEVVKSDFIYKDVKKGLKASPDDLKAVFGTEDAMAIAQKILKDGELQLTTEQRRKMLEAKKRLIITYISRNAVDPKTKLPIPPQRVEKAMEEARVGIDIYKPVEEQALMVVKALSRLIPIKIARALLEVTIPAEYAGKSFNEAKNLGIAHKVNWKNDGSVTIELEIPAGMQEEVIDKLNKLTKGEVSVKVLKVE
ncbi:MAG: ribosome assembly factor SBDS [Desulfurococcales archaeon]|jgi:ribosome maturation protein SDO1